MLTKYRGEGLDVIVLHATANKCRFLLVQDALELVANRAPSTLGRGNQVMCYRWCLHNIALMRAREGVHIHGWGVFFSSVVLLVSAYSSRKENVWGESCQLFRKLLLFPWTRTCNFRAETESGRFF